MWISCIYFIFILNLYDNCFDCRAGNLNLNCGFLSLVSDLLAGNTTETVHIPFCFGCLLSRNENCSMAIVSHLVFLQQQWCCRFCIHPGRLTWNLHITYEKKRKWSEPNLQGIMFHVNLQGCNASSPEAFGFYMDIWSNYRDLTRPQPKWWFSNGNPSEIPLFQGNLGWWNIMPLGQMTCCVSSMMEAWTCQVLSCRDLCLRCSRSQ